MQILQRINAYDESKVGQSQINDQTLTVERNWVGSTHQVSRSLVQKFFARHARGATNGGDFTRRRALILIFSLGEIRADLARRVEEIGSDFAIELRIGRVRRC